MDIVAILTVAIQHACPILLVAMGGLLAVRSNVFNLALEAFMLIGCFASIVGAYFFNNVWLGVLTGVVASTVLIMIYAVFIIEFHVQPIICAISIITLVSGLTRYLLNPIFGVSGRYVLSPALAMPTIKMAWLDNIPFIGQIFNNHSILVYFSLLVPFVIGYILKYTKYGLDLRAVGLNAEAAISAGISVKKIQYSALFINGVLCGLGGAQLALSVYMFNVNMTNGRGYTALAAIILSNSAPLICLLACLLFGLAEALVIALSTLGISSYLLGMLPYVMALVAALLPQTIGIIKGNITKRKSAKEVLSNYYRK